MSHEDDKILIQQNDFEQIKALMLNYSNRAKLFHDASEAEEAIRPVQDFLGLLKYVTEGDGILQMERFADILLNAEVIKLSPPYHNKWYDAPDEQLAMELDLLFRGLSNGLDDGLTDVLRV